MLDRVLTTAVMVGRHVGIEEGGRVVRNAYLSLRPLRHLARMPNGGRV
jgi:hypothetical protein